MAGRGVGVAREVAARTVDALALTPDSTAALRGLLFAAAGIDASRLERAGLERVLVDLLTRGLLVHEREAPARESGQAGRSAAEPAAEEADTQLVETDWIGLELVDANGAAVAWEPYVIELPDGRQLRGSLGVDGKAVVRGLPPGTCKITFPRRGANMWAAAG
ncbi:hypothetical protein SAMN02745121_03143 [Nannocystis exedens]|uniref:Carboxypeptidase regulatory-like domain-containing protein n=2 Tax=Nannocystis exedens TaxID=54 RepID=A0A1I1Y4F0_9BACT|nr:hypothetical protein NAEX_04870 [Nannocystis exedens]SFE14172.1 hypothetical protein SAMN02745121_03143 [Nannocystis exedens]